MMSMFKNIVQIGISANVQKQELQPNRHFEGLLSGPSLVQQTNGQLGPDNNPSNFILQVHLFQTLLKPICL